MDLATRLREYPDKRWKDNESYSIINDFLLTPCLLSMIENLNKLHRVKVCYELGEPNIVSLKLQCEKDKKPGLWEAIKRFFFEYETVIIIRKDGNLFLCEYYKHSLFDMCDKIKTQYEEKIKSTVGYDFAVVCRVKK